MPLALEGEVGRESKQYQLFLSAQFERVCVCGFMHFTFGFLQCHIKFSLNVGHRNIGPYSDLETLLPYIQRWSRWQLLPGDVSRHCILHTFSILCLISQVWRGKSNLWGIFLTWRDSGVYETCNSVVLCPGGPTKVPRTWLSDNHRFCTFFQKPTKIGKETTLVHMITFQQSFAFLAWSFPLHITQKRRATDQSIIIPQVLSGISPMPCSFRRPDSLSLVIFFTLLKHVFKKGFQSS